MDIACGNNHTLVLGENINKERLLVSFGHENGLGIEGKRHTDVPQFVDVKKVAGRINFIYANFMRSAIIDGENDIIYL